MNTENFNNIEDMFDEDGYPNETALKMVEEWPWHDWEGWFRFIQSIWYMSDWGWSEVEQSKGIRTYHVSTAGWSGNEEIVRAMQKNDLLWENHWVESRRGGHYIFERKIG